MHFTVVPRPFKRHSRTFGQLSKGLLKGILWYVGLLVLWSPGPLVYWSLGPLGPGLGQRLGHGPLKERPFKEKPFKDLLKAF